MIADGTILGSRYVIEGRLGEGGMGTVYRAKHVQVGRLFAVKVLHRELIANTKVVARFQREAELAGRLRHDHVVSVVDMGMTPSFEQYLVMEHAPGPSLAALIEAGAMPEARVLEIARQLCDGLQHAHEVGLVHRDFKPDNVLVEQLPGGREVARIVDFGVAILREDASDVDGDRLTTKGLVVGTPHYMAPEQARGGAVDHRVDLFALGLIMYEALCGRLPFDGDGVDVARANVSTIPPPMGMRSPGVKIDPVMEALVRKLLAKDPEERMPSAKAVRELIDLYVRDRAAAASLLGVRELATGGLPPADQVLAMGRSRSANHSAAPYQDLVTEEVPAQAGSRRFLVGTLVAAAALLSIVGVARMKTRDRAHYVVTTAAEPAPAQPTPSPPPLPPPPPVVEPDPVPEEIAEAPTKKPVPRPRASKPVAPATQGPVKREPTAREVADLYVAVGRELDAATKLDSTRTLDLWPRYRWIRIHDAMSLPAKRVTTHALLEKLRADLRGTSR